ncbi:hypothetical protein L915_02755 [Phytophthora nicotianae]|nr:hypothetical protein L915_02755 [Phytophthora nicotianae]ETL47536.1 hypothetical protein L916_02728 [Phytophthora nicotianae]
MKKAVGSAEKTFQVGWNLDSIHSLLGRATVRIRPDNTKTHLQPSGF